MFLSILLAFSAIFNLAAAETYIVGVPSGTIADYYHDFSGSQANRYHLDVTNVTTTLITFNQIYYSSNNSVIWNSTGLTYDVTNGLVAGDGGPVTVWFVAANLAVGTRICSGSNIFVNETISSYPAAGATRTVNHSNITSTQNGLREVVNFWWDKITGLLVKFTWEDFFQGRLTWNNITLTGTSLWFSSLSTEALVLVAAGVCVVLAVTFLAVVIRRRKQNN